MTTAPTRETVEALLALEAKATPGDWTFEENGGHGSRIGGPDGEWAALSCGNTGERAEANAALIAAARNLIRPLAEAYLATLDAKTILTPTHVGYAVAPNAAAPMCAQGQIYSTMVGPISGGRGGMVDAPDLKSGFSEGSNPSGPTTLDARREGEREALRGIRDFCESMSCDLTWKRAITEIDRRLAEGETT